jgi:hypothetical protein
VNTCAVLVDGFARLLNSTRGGGKGNEERCDTADYEGRNFLPRSSSMEANARYPVVYLETIAIGQLSADTPLSSTSTKPE